MEREQGQKTVKKTSIKKKHCTKETPHHDMPSNHVKDVSEQVGIHIPPECR